MPADDAAAGRAGRMGPGAGSTMPDGGSTMPDGGSTAPDAGSGPAGQTERCEMCAAPVPAEHGHVADLERSVLLCACRACYLLFTHPGAGGGTAAKEAGATVSRVRYRAVPDRYLADPARPISAAEWEELEIPVGLAFFLHDSRRGRVAGFYPSPAGVTECELDLAGWDRIAAAHPLLQAPQPDVEAALICRTDERIEHFLVPIDACYELAGRMRLHWRGFDGGAEARGSIAEFLDDVRSRARPVDTPDGSTGR